MQNIYTGCAVGTPGTISCVLLFNNKICMRGISGDTNIIISSKISKS